MLEAALHGKWPLSGVKGQEYATQTWSQSAMSTKSQRVIKALYLRWNSVDYKWVQEAVVLQQKTLVPLLFFKILETSSATGKRQANIQHSTSFKGVYNIYAYFFQIRHSTYRSASVTEHLCNILGFPIPLEPLRIRLQTLVPGNTNSSENVPIFWGLLYVYLDTNKIVVRIHTSTWFKTLLILTQKINKFGATSFDHSQGIDPFRRSEEHPSSHPIEVPEPLRESDIALCQYACCDALSSAWGVVGQRIWRQLLIAHSLSSILSLGHSSSEIDYPDLLAVELHN